MCPLQAYEAISAQMDYYGQLAAHYHIVCTWIGNTERIAAKHYLQVTDDYFERAAKSGALALQNPVQQPAALSRTESPEMTEDG